MAYRVHIGQLSVENDLHCAPFPKGNILHSSPFTEKESVKGTGNLNKCNFHCKSGFFMNYIFNHYYILQFTQNQFEESTTDISLFNEKG